MISLFFFLFGIDQDRDIFIPPSLETIGNRALRYVISLWRRTREPISLAKRSEKIRPSLTFTNVNSVERMKRFPSSKGYYARLVARWYGNECWIQRVHRLINN